MENKIIFLLVTILILYLLLTKKGKSIISGLVTSGTSSSSTSTITTPSQDNSKAIKQYSGTDSKNNEYGNIAGDKSTPYDGNNSSLNSVVGGGLYG